MAKVRKLWYIKVRLFFQERYWEVSAVGGGKVMMQGATSQGLVAVLEILSEITKTENEMYDWDELIHEPDCEGTELHKVDIALKKNDVIIKCTQVKSTQNAFDKSKIETALNDLKNDYKNALEYRLVLVGALKNKGAEFANEINGNNQLGPKVSICILPFEMDYLIRLAISSLYEYLSLRDKFLPYSKLQMIALALAGEGMIKAAKTEPVKRHDFLEQLLEKVELLEAQNDGAQIKHIGIRTFSGDWECGYQFPVLSLEDNFARRILKEPYSWESDILPEMQQFLASQLTYGFEYHLHMESTATAAFAVGRMEPIKQRGIVIKPIQKLTSGPKAWSASDAEGDFKKLDIEFIQRSDAKDQALAVGIAQPVYDDVERYITEANLDIGTIIHCHMESQAVENGRHTMELVNQIVKAVLSQAGQRHNGMLHVFIAAPNALTFFLGQNSRGFGRCRLYEYDFEKLTNCSYIPTATL